MAIYEINGQRYALPDDLSGEQLTETLTLLSESSQPAATVEPETAYRQTSRGRRRVVTESATPKNPWDFEELDDATLETIRAASPLAAGRDQAARRSNMAAMRRRQQAEEMERIRQFNPAMAQTIEDTGPGEAFLVGAGEGFNRLARGVGLADQPTGTAADAVSALISQSPAAMTGQLTAESLPFVIPAGGAANIASAPLRAAVMAGIGAAEGNILGRGAGLEGSDLIAPTVLGGMLAGGADMVAPAISRRLSRGADVAPANARQMLVGEMGEQADELSDQAAMALSREPADRLQDTARQVQRRELFERRGLKDKAAITAAQEQRTRSLFDDQTRLYRQSGAVTNRLERQNAVMHGNIIDATDAMGGNPVAGGISVHEHITKYVDDADRMIDQAYEAARQAAPGEMIVRPSNAGNALRVNAHLDSVGNNGIVKALRGEMRKMGVMGDKFRIQGRVSAQKAEELRQAANSLYQGTNPTGREIIRRFKDALDKDVSQAVGGDMFADARKMKASLEKRLRAAERKTRRSRRDVSLPRDIAEDKLSPQQVFNRAIASSEEAGSKYRAEDLEALKNFLQSGNAEDKAAGLGAWNDLRSRTMEWIRSESSRGATGENELGEITRNKLEKAINRIGRSKLKVLFDEKEMSLLDDLRQIAKIREPTFGSYSPSGPAIERLIEKHSIVMSPILDMFRMLKNRVPEKKVLQISSKLDDIQRRQMNQTQKIMSQAVEVMPAAAPAVAVAVISGENEDGTIQ